jgi:hypothetical protein
MQAKRKSSKTINKVKDVHARLPLQKSYFSLATMPEKLLDAGRQPPSWEPQEEGMMSTVASLPSVKNRGLSNQ